MKFIKKYGWFLGIVLVLAVAATLISLLQKSEAIINDPIMQKLPDSYTPSEGSFTLTQKGRIFFVSNEEPDEDITSLVQLISQQFAGADLGLTSSIPVVWGEESSAKRGDILLKIDSSAAGSAAEGYEIHVADKKLSITGTDKRGLMYGAFTAIKMFRANGSSTLGGCIIVDAPDAAQRTVMLDCGRKYFTPEWIKNYLREMAYMGYNTFEIHFAEDQGIRLDIWDEAYFTSANGNDFSPLVGGWAATWLVDKYEVYEDEDKYLTAQDMIEILEVAKQYQIEVIPSFDTPMHCQYLRYKWPAYVKQDNERGLYCPETNPSFSFNFDGKKYSRAGITDLSTNKTTGFGPYGCWDYIQVKDDKGVRGYTKVIDVTNPVARALLEALMEDYADFFKQYGCKSFNICADEVVFYSLDGWKTYARDVLAQKYDSPYMAENGSKYDVFTDYINEITDLLQEKGYCVRIFSDFVDRDGVGIRNKLKEHWYMQNLEFDQDLEIMYWWLPQDNDFVRDVNHFVQKNSKIYNCVQNYCYYVLATNDAGADGRDPNTEFWTFQYSTADRIYNNWNPTVFTHPEDLGTEREIVLDKDQVAGGYFLIWADYAALNTEQEVWNGLDAKGTYNIVERMWSNSSKMWNYDLNITLEFADFYSLCKKLGNFPGYSQCSAETELPAPPSLSPAK